MHRVGGLVGWQRRPGLAECVGLAGLAGLAGRAVSSRAVQQETGTEAQLGKTTEGDAGSRRREIGSKGNQAGSPVKSLGWRFGVCLLFVGWPAGALAHWQLQVEVSSVRLSSLSVPSA